MMQPALAQDYDREVQRPPMSSSTFALSNRQVMRAAVVMLFGFATSGVLGFVRTAVLGATFGTSTALDSFYAAQRLPEALYVLVAGGALGSSFIPVFARFRAQDEAAGWRLASAVMTCTTLVATVLAVIVALLAPQLVPAILAPGQPPDVQALIASLVQVMMATVAIFSISGLLMGILNAYQLFTLPALALSMNNIGLIIGALVFARALPPMYVPGFVTDADIYGLALGSAHHRLPQLMLGTLSANVYGPALGAVLGALLHLLVQLPGLPRIGARLRILPDPRVPGVRDVLLLMGPRVLGLGVVQVNFIVNAALSSSMIEGSYTALTTAFTLMFFVLGIIAQSVGAAVFPTLSALSATADYDGFKERLTGALRGVLFLAIPATVGLVVLGEPVITVLFEHGAWTRESTQATAWALAFFAVGVVGFAALEILSRAFYALSDTRTPVGVGVVAMVANIALSLVFIRFIGDPNDLSRGPFAGLALANAVTTLVEALALWWLLRRRIGSMGDRALAGITLRLLAAAGIMGLVVWLLLGVLEPSGPLLVVAGGTAAGAVVFFGLATLFGIEEARSIPRLLAARIRA